MTIDDPGFTLPTSNERELLLSYLPRGNAATSSDPPTAWTRRSSGGRPTTASCRSSVSSTI